MPKKHKMKGKKKTATFWEIHHADIAMSWGKNPYEKEDMGEIY
jgi:hypothetical protein